MKKLLLSLLFAGGIFSYQATAQIQKYTTLAGGGLSALYENDGNYKYREISGTLNPKAGFFFSEYFALGASLEYSYQNLKKTGKQANDTSTVEVNKAPFLKVSQFLVGPFMRFYLPNHLFTEASLGLGIITTLVDSVQAPPSVPANVILDDQESKHDVYRASIGIGYAKFLNAKVAIEPLVRYSFTSEERDSGVRSNRSGIQVLLGFQYYLFRDQMLLYK